MNCTNLQNFAEKDLTDVKIFQKVLGGYFLETPCRFVFAWGHQRYAVSPYALAFARYGARCVSALMGLVTLTFDFLILKLVRESYLRNLPSKFGHARPLDSRIIRLYATNGWTKATLTAPFPMGKSITNNHLLSRHSRQRERVSRSVMSICLFVCSFVCLSVCLSVAKMQKRYFLKN